MAAHLWDDLEMTAIGAVWSRRLAAAEIIEPRAPVGQRIDAPE